jgi:preprotein translocase subunit SecE
MTSTNPEHFPVGGFFKEFVSLNIYKRSQGRITRQVTGFTLLAAIAFGCYRLNTTMLLWLPVETWYGIDYWLPGILMLAGGWFSYRLMNIPGVADFLIAVEAEMNKVSWPTRIELFRASMVVLFCIIALALLLYGYDLVLQRVIRYLIL